MDMLQIIALVYPTLVIANGDVYLTPWPNTTDFNQTQYSFNKLGITHLQDYDFRDFPFIEKLGFHDNDISNVSTLAFDGTDIKRLYLSKNKLTEVPDVISLADSLVDLNLAANSITNVTNDVFKHLWKLQILKLDYNPIVQLPADAFQGTMLTSLYLHNTHISVWNPLKGLTILQHIDLRKSKLTTLDAGAFSTNPSLNDLRLDESTQLSNIDPLAFNGTVLKVLNLEKCSSLTQLPNLQAVNNTLEVLYIQSTSISTIPEGYFDTLTGLTTLDARGSPLDFTTISQEAFVSLTALTSLNMESSGITGNLTITLPPSLTTLDIRKNDLQGVEPLTFQGMTNLDSITASWNHILTFPDMSLLPPENCLKTINYNYNQITHINADAFDNVPCLERVYIKNNMLSEFPDFGAIKGSLSSVELTANNIQELPLDRITDLSFLNWLELSDNKIKVLSDFTPMISVTKRLTKLNSGHSLTIKLERNQISSIGDSFAALTTLPIPVNLYLGGNVFEVHNMPNFYRTVCSRSDITAETLTLSLVGSDLNCVQDACWLKTASTLCPAFTLVTNSFKCTAPAALNGQMFTAVDLDCPMPGSTCPGEWNKQIWWSVDLKQTTLVEHVVLKGINTNSVSDMIVSLSDTAHPLEATSQQCSSMCRPPDMASGVAMDCTSPVEGRFVFVLMRYKMTGGPQPKLLDVSLSDEGYY